MVCADTHLMIVMQKKTEVYKTTAMQCKYNKLFIGGGVIYKQRSSRTHLISQA